MADQPEPYLTLEEYLALETQSGLKHEYHCGRVYAMIGASVRHNLIVANTIAAIHGQLRGKPCTVYPSDLRIQVEATGLYTYPDLAVICGELRLAATGRDTVTNPTVLIEVLSPSTRDYDRGTKFQHYRTIDSLQEYIVIAQDMALVEQHIRQDEQRWLLIEHRQRDQTIQIESIGCAIAIADIYEKVALADQLAHDALDPIHPDPTAS